MSTRPPTSRFTVNLHGLRRVPGSAQRVERRGRLGELRVVSQSVPADAETEVDVTLEASSDGNVMATGTVTAPWQGECRRCLAPVAGLLEVEVRELYRPDGDGSGDPATTHPRSGSGSGESGLSESELSDEETYPLRGDQLDLAPLARDALLLSLPLAPLCRPDCAGLCPTCGADLNDAACDCPAPAPDPRWAGLDSLRGS